MKMNILAAMLVLSAVSGVVQADVINTAATFAPGSGGAAVWAPPWGETFTVGANPITVTALGGMSYYSGDQTVGIYTIAANQPNQLLASTDVNVAQGTGQLLTWQYTNLAVADQPTLAAGETYWIQAIGGNLYLYLNAPVIGDGLAYMSSARYLSPGYSEYYAPSISPNFQYTVSPEPATMALLAIGGIGAMLRRRK